MISIVIIVMIASFQRIVGDITLSRIFSENSVPIDMEHCMTKFETPNAIPVMSSDSNMMAAVKIIQKNITVSPHNMVKYGMIELEISILIRKDIPYETLFHF